jgi:cation:H+ antiporter
MHLLPLIAVATGLAALVWGAGRFVAGASGVARHMGLSPLLIGMLVVGFGTSAPELLVSVIASLNGNPGIALGNAYGSNIANITLILGLSALLTPVIVRSSVVRREIPVLIAATLLTVVLLFDLRLSRPDALLLLAMFAGLVVWSAVATRRGAAGPAPAEEADIGAGLPLRAAWLWTVVGLVVLVAGSRLVVWGAVETAQALGVSDLVIGLTIVAIGTSLPELAASLVAIRRGEHDIAIGNVIGSNLFNTLAVVGLAGAIRPIAVPPELLTRDLPVMVVLTLALLPIAFGFRSDRSGRVNRVEGGALLAAFFGYTSYLAVTAGG